MRFHCTWPGRSLCHFTRWKSRDWWLPLHLPKYDQLAMQSCWCRPFANVRRAELYDSCRFLYLQFRINGRSRELANTRKYASCPTQLALPRACPFSANRLPQVLQLLLQTCSVDGKSENDIIMQYIIMISSTISLQKQINDTLDLFNSWGSSKAPSL
jgi:hypothetical protein